MTRRTVVSSVVGCLGTIAVLLCASGGIVTCFGGMSGQGARCLAEHWGFATEGAFLPLVAAVWSAVALLGLRPQPSLALVIIAASGAVCGVLVWLGTRRWTFSQHAAFDDSVVTVLLRPTLEVAACWAVGGALLALTATALVAQRRGPGMSDRSS
jgi:hypothetical protein